MDKRKRKMKLLTLLPILILSMCMIFSVSASAKAAISKTTLSLLPGQTYSLKVTGYSKKIQWSSSNKSVVSVSSAGKLVATKAGTATVTAKAGSARLSCKVTVRNVMINSKALSMRVNGNYTLKLTGTTQKPKWTSSNAKIVSVSSSGKVTAKKVGKATITAMLYGKKYSCSVTVSEAEKLFLPNASNTGKGTAYIYNASGTSEHGRIPEEYVDGSCFKYGVSPITTLSYCVYDVESSIPVRVYIDGKQVDIGYVGWKKEASFTISDDFVKKGIHNVEIVQFKNNNPRSTPIFYRRAKYRILYK